MRRSADALSADPERSRSTDHGGLGRRLRRASPRPVGCSDLPHGRRTPSGPQPMPPTRSVSPPPSLPALSTRRFAGSSRTCRQPSGSPSRSCRRSGRTHPVRSDPDCSLGGSLGRIIRTLQARLSGGHGADGETPAEDTQVELEGLLPVARAISRNEPLPHTHTAGSVVAGVDDSFSTANVAVDRDALKRRTGFEPATFGLGSRRSTN